LLQNLEIQIQSISLITKEDEYVYFLEKTIVTLLRRDIVSPAQRTFLPEIVVYLAGYLDTFLSGYFDIFFVKINFFN
jgi:hypothetical protein